MWKHCTIALGSLLLSACALAQAAATLRLDSQLGELPLDGRMERLHDPSARMTLAEVQAARDWTVLRGQPDAGFTHSAIWLRLRLEQPAGDAGDWYLGVNDNRLDEAQLHSQLADGRWQVQRAGSQIARSQWPVDSRVPTFQLRLAPGQHVIYLRLQSQHVLTQTLSLQSQERYFQVSQRGALFFGFYFGIFTVAIVLQIFFWVTARDALSGWYLLYTLVLLLNTLQRSGYPQIFLDQYLLHPKLIAVYICLVPAVLVRLSAVWLELHRHLPRFNLVFQGSVYVTALLTSAMVLAFDPVQGLQLNQLLTIFWVIISFGLGLWLWRRKIAQAGFYVLIFGVVDLSILVRYTRNLGLLPANAFTDYALFLGILLHLLMMNLYFIYRYNRLQVSLRQAQTAREEQKDFVSMVSHEFRTPLAIINTSIQQLAANLDAPAERTLQRSQNIRNATLRLTRLLDDYLSLDRLDGVERAASFKSCDFFEVIEEATADWPLERIQIHIDSLPKRFVCDPDLMRIVLRNLLANADRHSPAASKIELKVSGTERNGIRIEVLDHGEGIPPEELPRVFQKYHRGRASQGKPGAGLGLYLVKRIVTSHGGSIAVQSTLGTGTSFVIDLPMNQAKAA